MAKDVDDLIAHERQALEDEAALTARERALQGKERALEERRRTLAEREGALRGRAAELVGKAGDLGATVHEEVREASRSQALEAPLRVFAVPERKSALEMRQRANAARERALDAAESAAARVDGGLREAEATLGHRENSVAALAREVIRRERSELERRETLARQMAADAAREAAARQTAAKEAAAKEAAARAPSAKAAAPRDPSADSGANRRQHRRFDVELEVSLSSEHNFFAGFTQNISEGGLFIATHEYAPLGTELEISLSLSTGMQIRTRGRVTWIREYNEDATDTSPGMGVQFLALKPSELTAINAFIKEREPMFYDL